MYIPKAYQVEDINEIISFIQAHPFATVVSKDMKGKLHATHMPLMLHDYGDTLVFSGHFAKSNEQWQTFNDDHDDVLLIFQGPHGYISSTWYENEDVPTWDYQSVQVSGSSWLLNDEETKEDLIELLNHFEPKDGARFDNLSDETLNQIHGIKGFRVEAKDINAAYKLSQNKSTKDIQTIIQQLKSSQNYENLALADAIDTYALNPKDE